MRNFVKLLISLVIAQLAGLIGSVFTAPAIGSWYATLNKPSFNPPPWLFAPVWIILYLLMGIAFYLIWKNSDPASVKLKRRASGLFFVQLILNAWWSVIFFGLRRPDWALLEIVVLWLMIVWTMIAFQKISRPAAYLLWPYLLWVSFAAYLNYSLWLIN